MKACVRNDNGDSSETFHVLSPLLFIIIFAAVLLVALQRFSEDPDILDGLVHLQEQPARVGPETTMECVCRAVWGTLYVDDTCIVSHSPQGLERMMATLVDVVGAFADPTCPRNADSIHHTGQQYRQTTSFIYLAGAVTESPKLSAEVDRRIRVGG